MRPEFDYVVSFEAVDTSSPQMYFRGEIEFHSLGLSLAERIRKVLKPFEQEFISYIQTGIRPIPRKLWKVESDSSRTLMELPSSMAREDALWEERKQHSWRSIPVGDPNSPF